jgi:hypothetical protein
MSSTVDRAASMAQLRFLGKNSECEGKIARTLVGTLRGHVDFGTYVPFSSNDLLLVTALSRCKETDFGKAPRPEGPSRLDRIFYLQCQGRGEVRDRERLVRYRAPFGHAIVWVDIKYGI